ncbi:MAG: AmmeMemoRadiSam system radical SAM enzyme [Candidatus Portnoybacteria bacterium]|nr:AmmeMemoRadiSam system radical SAM enzyme [Candidatus Portnoybacteria bacterium]
MHKALLYEKKKGGEIRCNLCNQHCIIPKNKRGLCGVRENRKGELNALTYGKVIAKNIDPIEKKPFYHFMPGTLSFSIATVGCNFRCLYCQNADISQISKEEPEDVEIIGEDLSPEEVISRARENNCPSISYTYTEPTIFLEYALDCMKKAKENKIKNAWVSNGYMTKEAIDMIDPYLDAINIDLKSFNNNFYKKTCGATLNPVLENIKEFKKRNIWLEITTLLIPQKNDSEEEIKRIAKFIKKETGRETPWHISAFYPTYKMKDTPPTPRETIERAVEIGKQNKLKNVYPGNI